MKIKKTAMGILLLITLALTGCSAGNEDKSSDSRRTQSCESSEAPQAAQKVTLESETEPEPDPVEEQINKMTLREKIGQMVIVGLDGYEMNENTRSMIVDYHVGGFILFRSNVKSSDQLLTLINSLKNENTINKVPLFLSVDEEGGRISRMPDNINKLPSAKEAGMINNAEFSYEIGSLLALEASSFGFNMDFAPVLDILSNPKNTVIGDRSFGSDADVVGKLGIQTMKGIRAGGVIPVVKHFPGHGDTTIDSHVGLPSVAHDMNRLNGFELVPFKAAVDNQAEAVMIAHIILEKVDPKYPASLSEIVISDVLRKQMGFSGVVITDDMTMRAIVENYEICDAAVKSVNAGSDIVLVCHDYKKRIAVIDALIEAAEDGTIKEQKVNESVYRILRLKNQYGLKDSIISSIDTGEINSRINAVLSTAKTAQ